MYLSIMAYQNINQYVFPKVFLRPAVNISDLSLTSDEKDFNEEVVFSNEVIGVNDGNKLPINIDLDSEDCNQQLTLDYYSYNLNNILISKSYYNPDNIPATSLSGGCYSSQTLYDIGLTGTDNGLMSGLTGVSISYTRGLLPNSQKFDRYSYDRRFKMFQVRSMVPTLSSYFSGITATTDYGIVSQNGYNEGYYNDLYGSFYQGFYKLFGYDYEVIPERYHKGWTMEMVLKPRVIPEYEPSPSETNLNTIYPENKNIFFYMGTRAEDKFYHPADYTLSGSASGYTPVTSGLTDLSTSACYNSAITNSTCVTVYPKTGTTTEHIINYFSRPKISEQTIQNPIKDPLYDSMSNSLAIMFSGNPLNPNICVRVLYFTGSCITTGSCFNTGLTYSSGYTVSTYCSSKGIYDTCTGTTFVEYPHWVLIDATFERNSYYDDCDLLWRGGLGDISYSAFTATAANNSISLVRPPITHDNISPAMEEIININREFLDQKSDRIGKLKISVNGKPFFVLNNFEEIIPRPLNTKRERQVGVPFNLSWGGGTQGLRENLTFSAQTSGGTWTYQQDPQLFPDSVLSGTSLSALTNNIIIEKNFAGTFDGSISQFRFYIQPLSVPEIQHNFRILKNKFSLLDLFCASCNYTPEYVLLTTEATDPITSESGDTFYVKLV